MHQNPKEILAQLQLTLPEVSTPGGSYVSVNIREHIAYVAIQFPIVNEVYFYQGRLGEELTTEEGYKAMELCALNVLAQVDKKIGFDQLVGLNHLDIYFQSGDHWDDAPVVANGASDLFVNVLGSKGEHSRALFGVHKLPRNFCVGLTATFTIKKEHSLQQ
ncbi:RidA family protein [Flavobacterium orientale]|uniref:LysR family transcriptional regulator n=1 Tax=Flavobacterium orientale TaxID=1756020 RepID=A0A916XXY7_9FLAO|nr:RidA family protein [Flavobacterium orientale]GGD18524.1 LysR family transcriptional regulator [Flavobacterium orientale]